MRLPRALPFLAALLLPLATHAATPPAIGSWTLTCPEPAACQLRATHPFIDKAGITADLEVMAHHDRLLPVLVLRGVPDDLLAAASITGSAAVTLRFDADPARGLACSVTGEGYVCAPQQADERHLADRLTQARAVTVHVAVTVPGMSPLPPQQRTLALAGTQEALLHLRAAGPAPVPAPLSTVRLHSPADMMATADRLLKAAGYAQGIAGAKTLLDQYRGR